MNIKCQECHQDENQVGYPILISKGQTAGGCSLIVCILCSEKKVDCPLRCPKKICDHILKTSFDWQYESRLDEEKLKIEQEITHKQQILKEYKIKKDLFYVEKDIGRVFDTKIYNLYLELIEDATYYKINKQQNNFSEVVKNLQQVHHFLRDRRAYFQLAQDFTQRTLPNKIAIVKGSGKYHSQMYKLFDFYAHTF